MIGTGVAATIGSNASAAFMSGHASRTMSAPAFASSSNCPSVASTLRVSVFVIVWTLIGASPPMATFPTRT
jgi:hypothetical protein